MKNTTNKTKQQPTKITKNRLTALILALILTATVLSPTIPVKAQETTVEGAGIAENNGSGGTSAGAGDNLPTDSFGEGYTRRISPVFTLLDKDDNVSSTYKYRIGFKGEGNLVIHSYRINPYEIGIVILSNKPMEYKMYEDIYSGSTEFLRTDVMENVLVSNTGENGMYYMRNLSLCLSKSRFSGLPNLHEFSDVTSYRNWLAQLGSIDLSKDNYKEPSETSAVYNKALDFASISADYKVKYTIEKNKDDHFEFITPDDAGIQFDWTNRTDIDGAYIKFTLYGEYYDSFWSTTYTNTYVSLTCDRKNDLTYLCKQKDMLAQAKEKCNGSKGYGFVVNYIYVQAFAKIDGKLCRSRIYKFNSDLVSDYGNADSEDDEWVPEITGGDSMPEEYEPDPENPDPEKTEPKPDKDDDTVVDTPVKYDPDVVVNDDVTYLEAFKQFINVMKQGISYLGDFPALVAKVFSFIPPIFILFIGIGFAVALLLRFLGR